MTFIASGSEIFDSSTVALANGESYTTARGDTNGYTSVQISVICDQTFTVSSKSYSSPTGGTIVETFSQQIEKNIEGGTKARYSAEFYPRARYYEFTITNNSGSDMTITNISYRLNKNAGSQTQVPLESTLRDGTIATITKSLAVGQQPDGDYVNSTADGQAFVTTTPLAAGESVSSDWLDTDGFNTIEVTVATDSTSANRGILLEFSNDVQAGTPVVHATKFFEYSPSDVSRGFRELRVPTTLDGLRVTYTNGDDTQSNFFFDITLRKAPQNGQFNDGNVLVSADFEVEVALGNISNFLENTKFGRNPEVDTGTFPEDIWSGGGTYTGFNATANQNLSVVSTSAADVGALRASGTCTTGGTTTLTDTSATFITSSVAVGNILLNDTQGIHGIITSVDSETQVTVFKMKDGSTGLYRNKIGDSYRIASVSGTGAAVVEVTRILNSNFERQTKAYFILNGTTAVTRTVSAYRASRSKVLLAGSGRQNAGDITSFQATTTANIFTHMPAGFNQSLVMADTVAQGEVFLIRRIDASLARANGAAGSAIISLRIRPFGQVFESARVYDITNSSRAQEQLVGGIVISSGTDVKMRVDFVSDNNTSLEGEIGYLVVDTAAA